VFRRLQGHPRTRQGALRGRDTHPVVAEARTARNHAGLRIRQGAFRRRIAPWWTPQCVWSRASRGLTDARGRRGGGTRV
jgi:hypothetical protein